MEKQFQIFVPNAEKAESLLKMLAEDGCIVSLEKIGRKNYVVVWQ